MTESLPIYIQHQRGDLSVQGWVQDRLRVKMKYRVLAESQAQADQAFKQIQLSTLETKTQFELRMGQAPGSDLVTKMRNRAQDQVQVDLEIKAPYQSNLSLTVGEGRRVEVEHWRGGVTITGKLNSLNLQKLLLLRPLQVACLACEVELKESSVSGRMVVGSKPVLAREVEFKDFSIDEGNESVRIDQCKGTLSVHTKAGRLNVNGYKGDLSFQSVEGGAFISKASGNFAVQTQSGQVMVDLDDISDHLHIDTEKSDIQVSLLPQFEGALDLMSLRGEVIVQFPYELKKQSQLDFYGPPSPGRIDGYIGKSSKKLVHAYTRQGGVRLLRKAPSR